MKDKKVLVLGNKPYYNFPFNDIIDSFDIIYRFNFAWPGKNNGTKFGKLAMCQHVYLYLVGNPVGKTQLLNIYREMDSTYLSDWYDFFQANKENYEEIYHQNEHNWGEWNNMLQTYGSPHRFSKMATTGYSTIFRKLAEGMSEIYVAGFSLDENEIRDSIGTLFEVSEAAATAGGYHSIVDETNILNWLHNNNKIDASLCMLHDTEEISINTNNNMKISKFILELINSK